MYKALPLCLLLAVSFLACNKEKNTGTKYEKLFEQNFLNRNFVITLARDHGTDLTAKYAGYKFILLKTDYYHGALKVVKGTDVYTGSWSTNDDYGKLDIELPVVPQEFVFLSRSWRFTSKGIPILKFAPWGGSSEVVLEMKRM